MLGLTVFFWLPGHMYRKTSLRMC